MRYQVEGYYWTVADLARELKINQKTLHARIVAGTFPGPTHSPGLTRGKYYTEREAANVIHEYRNQHKTK